MWCVKRTTICAFSVFLLAGHACNDEIPGPVIPKPLSLPAGLRSLQKCDDYMKYSSVDESSLLPSINVGTQLRTECTFNKTPEYIVGGERTKKHEFPHMALIGFDDGDKKVWDCGGSLISENHVLTAAHCLHSLNYGPPTVVRLGVMTVNDSSDDADVQQIGIKKRIPHPEYVRPSRYNDIALLVLETPPKLGIAVRPACLLTKRRSGTTSAIATGWGFTEDGGNKSDWLMKVVLKLFSAERCNVTYVGDTFSLKHGIDDNTQVCAGSDDEEKDTCQVLIGFGNDEEKGWLCGGTLISESFVLTAAHCLNSRNHGLPTTVRLGDSSINDDHVQQIKVKEYIRHPDFSLPSVYNDIALLKLESPAKLDAYVRPACLHTKNQIESEHVLLTSWDYSFTGVLSLRKKTWKVVDSERCNAAFSPNRRLKDGIVDAKQICAGPGYQTKDDCSGGDIGGPLAVYKDTRCMFDVLGITSFSTVCGSTSPSVFTRVYPYLEWIEDVVWS